MRPTAVLLLLALGLTACGDDSGEVADPVTTTTPTSADTTTTASTEAPTTTEPATGDDACEDAAPIPGGATDVETAPVDYDGDGDGIPDTLSVFRDGDGWWLHVEWSAGGSAAVALDDVGPMGARPAGGYDLDGDGTDEAFVSIGGPAAGRIVTLFRSAGCDLVPVTDAETDLAFGFPVTATVGTFSGATCDGLGDLDLYTGELVDPDEGEYLVSQAPYTYADGALEAGMGDAGSVSVDEVGDYSTLACGALASAL